MDAIEAWTVIGDAWNRKDGELNVCGEYRIRFLDDVDWNYGLCDCVDKLLDKKQIDVDTFIKMGKDIAECKATLEEDYGGYFWPCSLESANDRAQFCFDTAKKHRVLEKVSC